MNAETRAKEIAAFMARYDGKLAPMLGDYAVSIIAAAITRAENDKLEEAALWFEEQAKIVKGRPHLKEFPASLSEPICEILDGIPADLRDLKSKD